MSCGAECLLEMMDFSAMNYLRGNPAGFKAMKGIYDNHTYGGNNPEPSYILPQSRNNYTVGNSKQGYNLSADYFEMPLKISRYSTIANPFYNMATYQMRAVNVQKPVLAMGQAPKIEQNTALSEIDNLEAMILAAKAKEVNAWIQ